MKARQTAAGLMHACRPSGPPAPEDAESLPASAVVSAACSRARERVDRQRQSLRPLGWVLIAIVVTAGLGAGGGHGLTAMRERATRAGGTARAGPTDDGWLAELEVPG